MLSGRLPLHVNTENNPASKPGGVDLRMTLISEKLKAQGYATSTSGKWHGGGHVEGQLPIHRGFDRSLFFMNGNEDHYSHWFGIDKGWDLIRYMPLMTEHHPTPFGDVDFADGRLTFVNRKLAPGYRPAEMEGFDKGMIHRGSFTASVEKVRSKAADWGEHDYITDIHYHGAKDQ